LRILKPKCAKIFYEVDVVDEDDKIKSINMFAEKTKSKSKSKLKFNH
jgi:hypothetical protein